MSARILKVSEADYRNDKIGADSISLNYSTAKTLVVESPLHAYHQHPRLGGQKWEPTPESDAGLVFHSLLLEGGKGLETVLLPDGKPAADYRKDAAQAARDAIRAAGKTPVLVHKLEEAHAAVTTIRARMLEMGLALTGVSELAVAWEERSACGPVLCRTKLDHLLEDQGTVYDIKTAGWSVSPDECARHIYDSGYDIQYAANVSWLEKYRPELVGRVKFVFVFCERNPPYAVTPVELDGQFRHMGRQRWTRAVETWARCLRDKSWPGYVTKVTSVEPRPWAFTREQELTADAGLSSPDRAEPSSAPAPREVDPLDVVF